MNNHHRGEIVKRVVKNSGYSLIKLAKRLELSRGTLYKYFKQENLNNGFIIKVGKVLHYDFSSDIPDLVEEAAKAGLYSNLDHSRNDFSTDLERELVNVQRKYYQILEEYTDLLQFLVKIASLKKYGDLREEINAFVLRQNLYVRPKK